MKKKPVLNFNVIMKWFRQIEKIRQDYPCPICGEKLGKNKDGLYLMTTSGAAEIHRKCDPDMDIRP